MKKEKEEKINVDNLMYWHRTRTLRKMLHTPETLGKVVSDSIMHCPSGKKKFSSITYQSGYCGCSDCAESLGFSQKTRKILV